MSPRLWSRDLVMGARFAVTGGREGWVRMTLTAVGVGLGVALLLLCTALPNVFAARSKVEDARYTNLYSQKVPPKADNTFLIAQADTTWHDDDILGRLVEPEGRRAPLPPGVDAFPGKGEMVVSPRSRTCSPRATPSCCGNACPTGSPGRSARADSSAPTNWPTTRAPRG